MSTRSSLLLPAVLGLAGCSMMLPRGASDTASPFATYAEAQTAAERIRPFATKFSDLPSLGFDAERGKNVAVIPYPEIVARLAPYSGVPLDQLDAGIRACITAQADCRGYLFSFRREDTRREGNFLADFLNVRRVTHVTGWTFEALVVVSGETVLFRSVAGEPRVERLDRRTNPLGPLQPAGESAGSLLRH